jgi:hypothetical protein
VIKIVKPEPIGKKLPFKDIPNYQAYLDDDGDICIKHSNGRTVIELDKDAATSFCEVSASQHYWTQEFTLIDLTISYEVQQ